MSKGLTVEQAWIKFQQFKRDNNDRLLRTNGEIVTARNFDEFKSKWMGMKGGNRLNRIEYSAIYRTKANTAKKIRQRLIEEAYKARGISKEEWMNMSIRERGKKTKQWGISSLEDIKSNKLGINSKSYLDKYGIKSMVEDYHKERFNEEATKLKEELGVDRLTDEQKKEINKKLSSEISDYFFGS